MSKKILLIAPKYMDLYKDIIEEMERQQYEVDFIEEKSYKEDPNNIRGLVRFSKWLVHEKNFKHKLEKSWFNLLQTKDYNKKYDYCFILDGQSISPILFHTLRERNSSVKIVNYLFDTTSGVYHFEKNFKYFDKVFTFDMNESQKYNIQFLPIYWKEIELKDSVPQYNIFGHGAIKNDRYQLFVKIEQIAKKNQLTYYLKLYNFIKAKNMLLYRIRYILYRLLHVKGIISPKIIMSSYSTKETLAPSIFRNYIANAEIIIDTSAPYQDGMTARFMWSLGLGKKIITTNQNVKKYDFYDEKQILLYDENVTDSDIENFFSSHFSPNMYLMNKLRKYRIDIWLKTILD